MLYKLHCNNRIKSLDMENILYNIYWWFTSNNYKAIKYQYKDNVLSIEFFILYSKV